MILPFIVFIWVSHAFQMAGGGSQHQGGRSARSPDSEKIQHWKMAFSGDLLAPFPKVLLPTVPCNWALHELCLKHVSCRELWTLFRRNCVVDAQNRCLMANKNDCWQSYEGISWTGLGSCSCADNNSDCHWIRLQTNYNKCIYELSHDSTWHKPLNSPAQFYASRVQPLPMQETAEQNPRAAVGVDQWKAEQWEEQQKREELGRLREKEEEEKRRRRIAEEEVKKLRDKQILEDQMRRAQVEEEEQRKKAEEMWKLREEENRKFREQEKQKWIKEEEENRKAEEEEEMKLMRLKAQEERTRRIKEHEEWKRKRKEEETWSREMRERKEAESKREEMRRQQQRRKEEEDRMNARRRIFEEEAEERRRRKEEEEEQLRMRMKQQRDEELELMAVSSKSREQQHKLEAYSEQLERNNVSSPNPLNTLSRANGHPEAEQIAETISHPSRQQDDANAYYNTVSGATEGRRTTAGLAQNHGRAEKNAGKKSGIAGSSREMPSTPMPTQNSTNRHRKLPPVSPTEGSQLITQAESPPTSRAKPTPTTGGRSSNDSSSSIQQPAEPVTPTKGQQKSTDNEQQLNNNNKSGAADKAPVPAGTCPQVLAACERDEAACKWHLSELLIKCQEADDSSQRHPCHRSAQCSAALPRFVRFVPAPLAEAMLFCSPAEAEAGGNDFPSKLRHQPANCSAVSTQTKPRSRWSCTQTVQMCRAEPNCSRRLSALLTSCPFTSANSSNNNTTAAAAAAAAFTNAQCSAKSLAKCRSVLAQIRGTWLDEPCHCSTKGGSGDCRKWQRTLWPGNPCIDSVSDDFNELFLAGQLRIEPQEHPTTKIPPKPVTKQKQKQQSVGMELGDEVTLLPAEDEAEATAKKHARTKVGENVKSASREKANRTGNSKKALGKVVAAKTHRKTSTTTTTTTTTTTPTTDITFLAGSMDEEEELLEGKEAKQNLQLEPEAEEQQKFNDSSSSSQFFSYEFAKEAGNGSSSETAKNDESVNNGTSATTTQQPILPSKASTAGRQPLPTDGEFVTQRPPREGDGCRTRNIDGEWVEHYADSVFRQFHDWAGRCSSWCECQSNGSVQCNELGCLSDVMCEARHTRVAFGQRLYLENRGACQCHDGRFICDSSELQPELGQGLYLSLGYSKAELDLIREKVPKPVLERSGLISQSTSLIKDLATRLQFALERVLPTETKCRVAVLEHFPAEQVVLMQLQWFGVDTAINQSLPKWHSGKMEKHCSAYVRELELKFLLERADRYQLLLSTIKQIRVIDSLDALPPNSGLRPTAPGIILLLSGLFVSLLIVFISQNQLLSSSAFLLPLFPPHLHFQL